MEFLKEDEGPKKEEKEKEGKKKPLVVRVKRKRTQESADSICIEEHRPVSKKRGLDGLTSSLLQLSHQDATKILLTKIETIPLLRQEESSYEGDGDDLEGGNHLDRNTFKALKRSRKREERSSSVGNNEDREHGSKASKKNRESFNFIVTKSKKIFTTSDSSDSMVFVDMTHVGSSALVSPAKKESDDKTSKRGGRRILDPVTRMMDASIYTALTTNNFTDMIGLIDQGGDINYQRIETDGYTCLMAAVQQCNLAVVSKLIAKNANVLLQNQMAQTAMDIAEVAKLHIKNHAASKILIMVRQAAMEQYNQQQRQEAVDDNEEDGSEEFVYDIYACNTKMVDTNDSSSLDDKQGYINDSVPNIKVSGISLDDMGNAEIDFHYDSDWSDLAGDDDEDSNDENYFGNDYPDDESNDGYDRNFENMVERSDEDSVNDSDEDGGRLPRFDRNGVGRQLKPFVVDEHQSSFAKTSEEIENLWSLEGGEENRSGFDTQHASRMNDMAKRTGMHVGAQPREFDANGLPKFGVDLSDDEGEMHYANYGNDYEEYNNEAYDSGEESY